MINKEQKKIIIDFLSSDYNARLLEEGKFWELIIPDNDHEHSTIDDFAYDHDYYGNIVNAFIETLLRANLFKNVVCNGENLQIKLDNETFWSALENQLATDDISSKLLIDEKNPFNYELDTGDLINWVLNEDTLNKIYDKEHHKWLIPQDKLDEILKECSRVFTDDVYEYWSQYIHYTYLEDGYFDEHGFNVSFDQNNDVTINTTVDRFMEAFNSYDQDNDTDLDSIYNGVVSMDFIRAILIAWHAQPLDCSYGGWADDVDFDSDYADEIVNDILNN